jgi:hypothetical protein
MQAEQEQGKNKDRTGIDFLATKILASLKNVAGLAIIYLVIL